MPCSAGNETNSILFSFSSTTTQEECICFFYRDHSFPLLLISSRLESSPNLVFAGHGETFVWLIGAYQQETRPVPFHISWCFSSQLRQKMICSSSLLRSCTSGFVYIICRWGSINIFFIYLYISIIYIGGIIFFRSFF